MAKTMLEWAERLKALRDWKNELEEEAKNVEKEIQNADWHLVQAMEEAKVQNFTYAGTTYCVTQKVWAGAEAEHKRELYEALRCNGYGDLVTETVNANTLSSFVRERMAENENKLPGWLGGLVKITLKKTVGVRKAAR